MTLVGIVRISVVLLILVVDGSWIRAKLHQIKPGCRYEGRRYQEGEVVATSEPCLQCRCIDGALRCRLRVCPRLPDPPPSGCRVRQPGENVCCAELICGDSRDSENMLRRANTQEEDATGISDDDSFDRSRSTGCLHEGVRYGPGSAMKGSRRCEYCYCISGARRCIRPKCLLPLPGCTPLYAPHSCCPVAYNCTHSHLSTSTPASGNGCRVGDRDYDEGEMVRDIAWKAACDNCFCAMGGIRCVPLACAPPLQGCSPIVRDGHCCPSTYNCSGSIEVKATQNYASYAFISKDYAKFRKETNFFPAIERTTTSPSSVEGRGHRVVEERFDTSTIDYESIGSSIGTDSTPWPSTFETEMMENEILIETMDYARSTTTVGTTTTTTMPTIPTTSNADEEVESSTESVTSDTTTPTSPTRNSAKDVGTTADGSITSSTTSVTMPRSTTILLESTVVLSNESALPTTSSTSYESTTTSIEDVTTIDSEKSNDESHEKAKDQSHAKDDDKILSSKDRVESTSELVDVASTNASVTMIAVNEREEEEEEEEEEEVVVVEKVDADSHWINATTMTEAIGKGPVTSSSSTIVMPDDILVMNVTVKTNVSVGHIQGVTINPIRSIPPDVEAILDITHREKGEDYEFDYSAPTLPPSLPNVRIIPFVAADALVKEKDVSSAVTGYTSGSVVVPPELRPTDTSGFYDIATQENRFSPPIETEGGFVPREPPYFDAPYHSTDLNSEIGTGITSPHRKTNDLTSNCLFENREYRHGEILPSSGMCIICICYYGEVVCSSEKCLPLKIGCRRVNTEGQCCGKIVCVDAEESPTVVLDRADATDPSQRQPIVSPDPFRDVIKTEPAPDLPSLIEDMLPYLVERGMTTPMTTTASVMLQKLADSTHRPQHQAQSFDYMVDEMPLMRPAPFDYGQKIEPSLLTSKNTKPNGDDYDPNRAELPTKEVQLSLMYETKGSDPLAFPYERTSTTTSTTTTTTTSTPGVAEITSEVRSDVDALRANSSKPSSDHETVSNTSKLEDRTIAYSDLEKPAPSTKEGNGSGQDGDGDDNDHRHGDHSMENLQEDGIFSLDGVFDFLFSPNAFSKMKGDQIEKTTTFQSSSVEVQSSKKQATSNDSKKSDRTTSITASTTTMAATTSRTPTITTTIRARATSSSSSLSSMNGIDEPPSKLLENEITSSSSFSSSSSSFSSSSSSSSSSSVASPLKLAGCNIYGRMYRVGRIITELSSPCLECRCTEIGVQCKQLEC